MIAQNDALDEHKKYTIEKKILPTEKMALGVRKWPFLGKNIKFWPKMAIFSGPKIFKKIFFALKYISDHFKSFPDKKFSAKKISYL